MVGDTWGFTKFTRAQYEFLRDNSLLIYDGINAKRFNGHGEIRTTKNHLIRDTQEVRKLILDSGLFNPSSV